MTDICKKFYQRHKKLIKKAVKDTTNINMEHGFVVLDDDTIINLWGYSDEIASDIGEMKDWGTIKESFHTHPSGIAKLSDGDKQTARELNLNFQCVANADEMYCETKDNQNCTIKF